MSDTILLLLGCLSLLGVLGLGYYWSQAHQRQTRQQLQTLFEPVQPATHPEQTLKPGKVLAASDSILKKQHNKDTTSWYHRLEQDLERANLLVRVNEYLGFLGFVALGVGLLNWLVFQLPLSLAIVVGLASMALPHMGLQLRIWWRMRTARIKFPEVLDSMVSCFKTGYGFNRAVQQIADNYPDPWGTECSKMALETSLGSTMDDILSNLHRRIPNGDVELFVASMLIQKDTGGNLTEMLGNLSHTCRERYKLERKVAAISAQGKLTAVIVCLVPVIILALMYAFMGAAVTEFLNNLVGQIIMGVMGCWMGIGMGVLWKMVQIEV